MLEIMHIILAKIVWFVGSTQTGTKMFCTGSSINLICALPKLFTQNRYSPMIAVYSTCVVHYRDTIIYAHCIFDKQFNA